MSVRMNLRDKLYQWSVLERILNWDEYPYVVELDPTAACDLACPGCISEDLIALGNKFTDKRLMELGQEFIDCGVKAVILIGGGEPLAHRKIGDFIELLGENHIHIGITTNGSFIDRYLDVISTYSKWTRVSMDAATETMFGRLRPTKGGNVNKFSKIVENMRKLAAVKNGKLGYSFLIQTPADGVGVSNVWEIYDAAVLARDIGCDYFEVKPTYQFRNGIDHALMKHAPEFRTAMMVELGRLEPLETDKFKIVHAINLQASLYGVQDDQPKAYHGCPSTRLRTTVTPTGAFVCPYWRGKEHMKVGDPVMQSFSQIWNGVKRHEVMTRLDPSKDCQFHCLRHETNVEVLNIKERLDAGVSVSAVEEFDRFL